MEKQKFEEALKELEEVVSSLEGNIALDEAVSKFQRGIELSKTCMENLKEEKGKLQILMDDLNGLTEDFKLGD